MSKGSGAPKKLVAVVIKRRRDKKDSHHHVILGDIDDRHVSVGLTTQKKKGYNSPNYPLANDPVGNLDAGQKAYMRRRGTVAPKIQYEQPRKGAMTPADFERAKVYGEREKQKYLAKKGKKKR